MTLSKTITLPLDHLVGRELLLSLPIVMAIDPGGTTGWVALYPNFGRLACGQITGQHHSELLNFLNASFGTFLWSEDPIGVNEVGGQLVCESFEFRQHRGVFDQSKVELDSCEYIGIVKLYAQTTGIPIEFQTASAAKFFVSDDKLRKLEWYKPTAGMVHARDALRHLLRYLVVTRKIREPFANVWLTNKRDSK